MKDLKIETIYRVGEHIFNTLEEAQCFVAKIPEMYECELLDVFGEVDYKFKPTEDAISAVVVHFENKGEILKFIEMNNSIGYDTNGITEKCEPGWYGYDTEEAWFLKVPDKETAFKVYRGTTQGNE